MCISLSDDSQTSATRVHARGALIIGAPGTSIRIDPDSLVIENRPVVFHYMVVGICLPIGIGILWLLWPFQPVIALLFFAIFVAPVLILFNRQRYEIRPGRLAARGSALGMRRNHQWDLPAESAVRVASTWERDSESSSLWLIYQAQLLTSDGWVGIAESANRDVAEEFARQMAAKAQARLEHEGLSVRPHADHGTTT